MKLVVELQCEKAAWTDHEGEIWEWGSVHLSGGSVPSPAARALGCPTLAQAEDGVCQPGAGPGVERGPAPAGITGSGGGGRGSRGGDGAVVPPAAALRSRAGTCRPPRLS